LFRISNLEFRISSRGARRRGWRYSPCLMAT